MSRGLKFINNREEHLAVLRRLNLLDDMDDWPMYQEQEREYIENYLGAEERFESEVSKHSGQQELILQAKA